MEAIDFLFRRHKIYIVYTNSIAHLYKWGMWQRLFPMLDAILKLSKQDAFIRTHQIILNENKWLGFGRMRWNFDNNKKWTTKYLGGTNKRESAFFDTEIWAPDWNYCCDKNISPDLFVKLCNNVTSDFAKEYLIFAISPKLTYKHKDLIENKMGKIVSSIPHSNIVNTARVWGSAWKNQNTIGDINTQEVEQIIRNFESKIRIKL